MGPEFGNGSEPVADRRRRHFGQWRVNVGDGLAVYCGPMRIETALLDLVVGARGSTAEKWLDWVVDGGEPPRSPGNFDVAWPSSQNPV